MTAPQGMDADARIKLALGTQFVEAEFLRDQVANLTMQLAERDKTIAALIDDKSNKPAAKKA